jgi:hypothetical protein
MKRKNSAAALTLISMLFGVLFSACGDRSGEVLFYCDDWDECRALPTTVCSDQGICVCPAAGLVFCGEECIPRDICYPPPECSTSDAGAPDGG